MPKPQLEAYITPRCWSEVIEKMPIPCVDTIVHRDDRVLLGYRTIPPYRNVWALLGGRMRYGESFEDTSIRNCRESGVTVQKPRYLGIFPVKFQKIANMFRHANIDFVVGGAYAFHDRLEHPFIVFSGDLDFYVSNKDMERASDIVESLGYCFDRTSELWVKKGSCPLPLYVALTKKGAVEALGVRKVEVHEVAVRALSPEKLLSDYINAFPEKRRNLMCLLKSCPVDQDLILSTLVEQRLNPLRLYERLRKIYRSKDKELKEAVELRMLSERLERLAVCRLYSKLGDMSDTLSTLFFYAYHLLHILVGGERIPGKGSLLFLVKRGPFEAFRHFF